MRTVGAGDAHHKIGGLAAPIDGLLVADKRNRGLLNGVLGLIGAVRNGQAIAHEGGHGLFPLVHGIHIRLVDGTHLDQQLTRLINGGVAGFRGPSQHNVVGNQ